MIRGQVFVVAVLLSLLLSSGALAVAETAEAPGVAASDTAALAAAIDRLATALDRQAGREEQEELYQKLNLAIAYLNFRSRRIEALERDLQQTRSAKAQIERTLGVWIEQREELGQVEPANNDDAQLQRVADIEMRISLVKERLSSFDDEIVVLENKIYELQGQIDSVEDYVRKNLSL